MSTLQQTTNRNNLRVPSAFSQIVKKKNKNKQLISNTEGYRSLASNTISVHTKPIITYTNLTIPSCIQLSELIENFNEVLRTAQPSIRSSLNNNRKC